MNVSKNKRRRKIYNQRPFFCVKEMFECVGLFIFSDFFLRHFNPFQVVMTVDFEIQQQNLTVDLER